MAMLPNLSPIITPFLYQNRHRIIWVVIVGLLNSGMMILLPLTIGSYYELLLGGASNRGQMLQAIGITANTDWATFWGLFVGLIAFRGLLEYAENWLAGELGEGIASQLRTRVFERQLTVRLEIHRQKSVGKYLLRYASDFQSVRRYIRIGVLGFVRDVLFILMVLGLLVYLNAPVTGLLVMTLVPFWMTFGWFNKRLEKSIQHRRDQRSANLAFVQTRLIGLETIKLFNREPLEIERNQYRSSVLSGYNLTVLRWRNYLNALLPVALFTMVGAVLAGVQWQHTSLPAGVSSGTIITFILAVLNLRPVLRRLLRVGSVWKAGRLSLDKLALFFEQPIEDTASNRVKITAGTVEFRDVSFGYNQKTVISNLSFCAERGQIFYLKKGAKSSVFRLLTKQYEPLSGEIWIDKQPLSKYSPKEVRRCIALISRELPLLGRTVFEAISYSRKPEKRSEAAMLLTQIQTLAQLQYLLHLDDHIGENGQLLSQSQRTVLYWVRALLTNKSILLLDEPFEGLSAKGITQLHQWLERQVFYKTIILASNLPSSSFHHSDLSNYASQ